MNFNVSVLKLFMHKLVFVYHVQGDEKLTYCSMSITGNNLLLGINFNFTIEVL